MALHLHCKRSKIFRRADHDREQVVTCARNETTVVPDWVKEDIGYKMGIKDKSIVDLTPPKTPHVAEVVETLIEKEEDQIEEQTESVDVDVVDAEVVAEKKPKKAASNIPKGLQGGSTVVRTK